MILLNKLRRTAALAICMSFIAGCASQPTEPTLMPNPPPMSAPDEVSDSNEKPVENIDYLGLHRSLGLERGESDLGYAEKSFDTCDAGFGYSASSACRKEYFVVIHFQILCRDSEGTISTALGRDDMKPLSGRMLNWSILGSRGKMSLDGQGYGQIKTTFKKSQRLQRLKLAVDNDFVYVRAGEAKRLVTPKNWCN